MLENSSERKIENKKTNKHLREGVSPIVACVGNSEDFKYDGKINWILSGKPINYAHDIAFGAKPEELKRDVFEFKNDGHESYVISPVDSIDKYSKNYHDCTGVIITGKEKGTGKNISFMSHQDPSYFLGAHSQKFPEDLTNQIQELKKRCEGGTIDAVIFGGRYAKGKNYEVSNPGRDLFIEEYKKSIRFLSENIKSLVGFEPLVIVGPKTEPGADTVFYDNDTRRLFLVRNKSKKNESNDNYDFNAIESFLPSELEEISKKWKPGEWGLPI